MDILDIYHLTYSPTHDLKGSIRRTKYLTDFSISARVLMVIVTAGARTAPCTGPAATAPGSPGTRASAGGQGGPNEG